MVAAPDDLLAHLRANAGQYYPALRGKNVTVRCLSVESRARSRLYRFVLSDGTRSHNIVVKEPRGVDVRPSRDNPGMHVGRPRLVSRAGLHERYAAEYATLRLVEERLGHDPVGIAVVRALDYLDTRRAIVMEEVRAPTLRALMARHTRLHVHRHASDLDAAFTNAGVWLSAYHGIEVAAAQPRQTTRAELLRFAQLISDYLARTTGEPRFFQQAMDAVARAATRALPEQLPLCIAHGDFAMRNLFVLPNGSVAAIDMWPRWRTAPYEDLAYFLVSLRNTRVQLLSQHLLYGRQTLETWESAFLLGYYGPNQTTRDAVRSYEFILLMDAWAARPASGPSLGRSARWLMLDRAFRSEAERLLKEL